MRNLLFRLALVFAIIGAHAYGSNQAAGPRANRLPITDQELAQGYRSRVLIVKPLTFQGAEKLDAAEAAEGFFTLRNFERLGRMRVLEVPEGMSLAEALSLLKSSGRYEFVVPDRIYRTQAVPNDPSFSQQWSLKNTGSTGGIADVDIKAVTAWDTQSSASDVVVAVIDSGLRLTHQDISANLWVNSGEIAGNGIDDDGDGYIDDVHGINATVSTALAKAGDPTDDNGHGSHVSGIIGAAGNNGLGIAGVAWSVKIMALKFLESNGFGSFSDGCECIDYAIKKGARIINASYGSDSSTGTYYAPEYTAYAAAKAAGIVVVVAAGNDAANIDVTKTYPACYQLDNIISVANSTALEDPSSRTNYGQGTCDLFAPGDSIYSLYHTSDSAYKTMSGTSMSAPHVAGALALIKARFSSETYRQNINRLLRGVDPVTKYQGLCQTGGRLNLYKALTGSDNRPFNDDFSGRARLTDANAAIRNSNEGATMETSEPAHAGVASYASLWWQWTAPSSGTVTVDTTGSAFDTVLAIYAGTSLSGLTAVASNDNYGSETTSRVSFTAVAGQSYQIAIASRDGSTGLITASIGSIPANDSFANAKELSGLSASATGSTANASRETGEPKILSKAGGRSLWYKWTAPSSSNIQVSACSTDFDPMLAVYTGTSLSGLTLVASNNDISSDNTASLCSFQATAGTTYMITIDSTQASNSGRFVLSLVDSVWQYPASDSITNAPTASSDGTILYFGDGSGYFYALNYDGTLKWRYALSYGVDSSSAAVADDESIIFPTLDGYLYALTSSGNLKWKKDLVSSAANSPAISSDGVVYCKGGNDTLYAFTLSTGVQKWSYELGSTSTYAGPVIGTDGTIYIGGADNYFHAVNADGTRKWRYPADQDIYTSAAIDSLGNLYFGTTNGTFYSLTSAGVLRWKRSLGSSITSSPAIADDGTVYFASYGGNLHALNGADGADKWTYALGAEVRASSPAIDANGTIYVGCYDNLVYAVTSSGTLSRTFATGNWVRSSPLIAGTRLYFGSNDKKFYAFDLTTSVATGAWPMKSANMRRLGRAIATSTVTITTQPASVSTVIGNATSFSVAVSGTALSYQWYKDGVVITGATSSTYTISAVTAADAGSYTVGIGTSSGTVYSRAATLTAVAQKKGRIIGLAARGPAGKDSGTLIIGFVLSGGASGVQKPVILRGLGPQLAGSGITNYIPNPKLTLYSGGTVIDKNLDWGASAALVQAFSLRGLGPLSSSSPEAAILRTLPTGPFTAHIVDENGTEGVGMGEIYDYDLEAAGDPTRDSQSKLLGISARARIADGDSVLIGGFVIDGNVPLKILIRGIGPGLSDALSDYLPNPKLTLYKDGTPIYSNDDWSGDASVASAAGSLGMSFTNTASKDAALLVTLEPGAYTVIVSSSDGSVGVGMVDIYQIEN
jgi:outer membrane protein assembly factor BamB/subtilisin family serine protease